jgi:hypothetical protein
VPVTVHWLAGYNAASRSEWHAAVPTERVGHGDAGRLVAGLAAEQRRSGGGRACFDGPAKNLSLSASSSCRFLIVIEGYGMLSAGCAEKCAISVIAGLGWTIGGMLLQ